MALQGIDVSNWKNIDVTKARDFVIVQTTWGIGQANSANLVHGVSTIADKQFQAARAAGKRVGFMHYFMGGDPDAEAKFFADNNRGYFGIGIPMIDWESADNPSFKNVNVFDRLLQAFTNVLGGPGIVYFQQSEYKALKPIADKHNWGSFVAQYADMNPTGIQESPWNEDAYSCAIRQYSSTGDIGAGTSLDLDKFYGDENAWDAYVKASTGGTPAPAPAPAPSPAPAPEPAPQANTYTVQRGDTLSGIAAKYGTSWQELQRINSISDPNLIYAGQVLTVTGQAQQATAYTVQSGDTLSGIAARYGTTYQALAAKNGISDPNRIYIGQVINI